ncbi:hypothetical protein pipiens_012050 [Culex pipiens pipiens]|uniref:Uncharacterized protein n=1 Tax=Culex pipiens pipiens TaxID=38569 RepID=A0ABD1D3U9_CULPP
MSSASSLVDLLTCGGQFGNQHHQKPTNGQVSRMVSEDPYRANCRKDSSDLGQLDSTEDEADEEEIDLSQFADEKQTRAYFRKRLAIFEASMKTPAAANRRLAARKIEMESATAGDYECIPPKQLLMYLVSRCVRRVAVFLPCMLCGQPGSAAQLKQSRTSHQSSATYP